MGGKPSQPPHRALILPFLSLLLLLAVVAILASFPGFSGLAVSAGDDPRDRPYPHGDWQEDCSFCHPDDTFLPIRPTKDFDHGKYFPLQGAHQTASCRACHKSLEFPRNRGRKECVNCHQDIHRGEFGLDCSRCHTPRSFIDRADMVRSHRTYRFPLTGAHVTADCEACHRPQPQGAMSYLSLSTDCAACHFNPEFKTATQRPLSGHPDRVDCEACHNTVTFTFNHSRTGFPLTGQHATLACTDCHGQPFNPDLDPACASCHLDDYNSTTDPNHATSGFPLDCTLCHSTTSFVGATFNHSSTRFPLTGAHTQLQCADCHSDGVYSGKPSDCYSCHRPLYEAQTDPNHVVAGFDHDCSLCHTTTSFSGARFTQHDSLYFPIYSGTHVGGRWDRCSDCHTNPSTYADFSCLGCHDVSDTDSRHSGVPGYVYESSACYDCHPRGDA